MSDVMPYRSTRFSEMSATQLAAYRAAWRRHLGAIVEEVRPHVIHAHHVWLVASLLGEVAGGAAVVSHCHATGLRQMRLCPHLGDEVRRGCARHDRFLVLHREHAAALVEALSVPEERVRVVGAGYRDDLFRPAPWSEERGRALIYVGKYSAAKGLPWLLDALQLLRRRDPSLRLYVAGSGAGAEAERLRERMLGMAPAVKLHGQLDQPELAALMSRAGVCVLPSFYEGVPLVLAEARACGCQVVSTRLPGVVERLAPHLAGALELVPLPRLVGVDTPEPADLPRFVDDLAAAIERSLGRAGPEPAGEIEAALAPLSWDAVFAEVERSWRELSAEK